jgi:hypothetical protein
VARRAQALAQAAQEATTLDTARQTAQFQAQRAAPKRLEGAASPAEEALPPLAPAPVMAAARGGDDTDSDALMGDAAAQAAATPPMLSSWPRLGLEELTTMEGQQWGLLFAVDR